MQDPKQQDISELLELASDVKSRLRRIENDLGHAGAGEPPEPPPGAGTLLRVRNHLELALEALGSPTWGLTAPPVGALQITGFYSSNIYKALRDVRKGRDKRDSQSSDGDRRNGVNPDRPAADDTAHEYARTHRRDVGGTDDAEAARDATEGPQPVLRSGAKPGGGTSKWVKSRVDEIQRALTAAFGEDELLPDLESQPKPFSPPEFVGNTDVLSVPELVGFFQSQGKTGVLTIETADELFKLEYLRGELIHAASSSSPDGQRLGEILVHLGYMTNEQLEELLDGKSGAERLGDALRRGDLVSDEALAKALEYQVQNIFHRMFDLKGCRFTFREGLEGEPRARVRYNVTRLLLETARHRDEQRQAS